eukprot:15353489-Ditylum_brightwellii.AAC.2
MVVVPMTRADVVKAVEYSRKNRNERGEKKKKEEEEEEEEGPVKMARRGYLQINSDFDLVNFVNDANSKDIVQVALPRNLMGGFCNITPLINLGTQLQTFNIYPSEDDFVPALDLVTRYCCKSRWVNIIQHHFSFDDVDLNGDGVLDRSEIKIMMERFLGYEPGEFVVDD